MKSGILQFSLRVSTLLGSFAIILSNPVFKNSGNFASSEFLLSISWKLKMYGIDLFGINGQNSDGVME